MQSECLQTKQLYLRQHILEAGYDPESFMTFCEEIEGHIDLEGWPLGKLELIVSKFITHASSKEQSFTPSQLEEDEFSEFQSPATIQEQVTPETDKKEQPIVFSQADWGIFGLNVTVDKPSQQTASSAKPSQQTASSAKPSQRTASSAKPSQQIASSAKPSQQIASSAKQVDKPAIVPSNSPSVGPQNPPNLQSPQITDSKIPSQNGSSGYSKNQYNSQSLEKIIRNGHIKISVSKSKQMPPLPKINDIRIIKTEQKSRNFLKGDYTLYHIKFNPCGLIITRKFSDFRRLRVIIQKVYPHLRVPYLEPEGWLMTSSEGRDAELLHRYKNMLIEFLSYILIRNQTLRRSKVVRMFTGFIDCSPSDLKKYDNIKKPKLLNELCLSEGCLGFETFESLAPVDKYMANTSLLTLDIDSHYQRLKKTLETLFYNYEQTEKSITDVACIFQSLESCIQKFNMENEDSKDLRIYEGIKQVCLRMRETLNDHHQIFKKHFLDFFRYERENMTTLKPINDTRSKTYMEYCRQGLTHNKFKPGQCIAEGDVPIDEPSKIKTKLITQTAFWSYFALDNAKQYWKELREKVNQRLTAIAYEALGSQNDILNFWNHVIKRCVV